MFYRFIRGVAWFVLRLAFRIKVTGVENIPNEGAFLLCGNHISALDAPILATCVRRQLYFMAKKELFKNRLFAAFFYALGVFPVDRGGTDMQAYRRSMEILENENGLMIFSQGHRMNDFENFKGGAAVFALKTGAPIVPVGIKSQYRFRSTVHINVGLPISMKPYEGQKVKSDLVTEVMEVVVSHITKLAQ